MTTRNVLSGGGSPRKPQRAQVAGGGSADEHNPAPPAGGGSSEGSGYGPPPADDRGGAGSGGGNGASSSGAVGPAGNGRIRVNVDPERDLACARLPLTDLGNAERWRVRFGHDFRFCAEIGWFAWDGRRWALLSEEKDALPARVMQSVFATVRAIRNEAALVAASGYPPVLGMSDKQLRELEAWTDAEKTTSWDLYANAAERAGIDGPGGVEVGDWLAGLEPMDVVLGKKLWSQSIAAWAKTSEGAGKLLSIAKLAKSFPDVAIGPDALDADRMAINVENGTLRIVANTRKLTDEERAARVAAGKKDAAFVTEGVRIKRFPHDRADLLTKLAPVKYAPNAACPHYDTFIARVQPDETMRRFIHQWGGLSLTGDIGEQKLAFFYGGGSNGKGTWVEAVAHLAGDYAGSIPIESFLENGTKRRGDQATPDIARLPGVRFLRVSEPEKGSALNEGLIKMVTGGDPVDARHLNKGFFTFLPSFKMTISGNHKPKVKDTSDGIWRRMQLVPWEVNIPAEERDRQLGGKLQAEASGILNRLLEGLIDWRQNGLIEPEQVKNATRAYRDASDELGRFLSALCEVGDDPLACRVKSSELFEYYTAWCEAAGGSFWKAKGFVAAMEDKGFERKTSNGVWWLRVRLRDGLSVEEVKAGYWPSSSGAVGPQGAWPEGGGGGGAEWPQPPDYPDDPAPDDWV
ncbi:DNA primase family protein [Tsuneonella sp. HG094]